MHSGNNFHLGILILRVFMGGFLAFAHGLSKLINFGKYFNNFADPVGLGSELSFLLILFAEFFCSIAIILGLFTRWATIPVIIGMVIIAFVVHADDPWHKQEFALMYATAFSSILITGPGKFSLDRVFFKK